MVDATYGFFNRKINIPYKKNRQIFLVMLILKYGTALLNDTKLEIKMLIGTLK